MPAFFVKTIDTKIVGSGNDSFDMSVTEDAYLGDAQFTISVDGQQIDGVQVADASRTNYQREVFTIRGDFGLGPHFVTVDFLNDLYGGSATTDRNLYVSQAGSTVGADPGPPVIYSGTVPFPGAPLYNSGSVTLPVTAPITETTPIVLTGPITVFDSASLNAAIALADTVSSGDVVIRFANDIVETATLDAINLHDGVSLSIDGAGHRLDGAGSFRGLFAYAGTISVENLAISNTVARGGAGGGSGAGGGAGLGGGLFVAGTNAGLNSGAAVRLTNVTFSNDKAIGGAGAGGSGPYAGGGGGGGLGGDGGSGSGGGGGGVGGAGSTDSGNGQPTSPGAPGIIFGAAKAGDSDVSEPGDIFNVGGPNGGGGGGGPIYISNYHRGGGGGVGGADAARNGGNGGFGGGGGGGTPVGASGGDGGFGGGGGGSGGNGGFGGGGAASSGFVLIGGSFIKNGVGGFGAGDGSAANTTNVYGTNDGGGGLGAGGAIFVQQGGSLTIANGGIGGGSAVGGAHGVATGDLPTNVGNGQGLGYGIFLQGDQTLDLTSDIGQRTTISDVIADMTGSGGTGANAGGGIVSTSGAGVVALSAANTYSGGTLINGTTLALAAMGAAGSGAISFVGRQPATLRVDAAAMAGKLPNPILGFGAADRIDLAGLGYDPSATAVISAHSLVVQSAGMTTTLDLPDIADGTAFVVTPDGGGGVLVSEATPLAATDIGSGADTIGLAISEDSYQGDAQFIVSVNGNQVGGAQAASASHASGQDQLFAVHGDFGPDARNVTVTFLNDAYGGSGQADRNLYVDRIDNSGVTSFPNAGLYFSGPTSFLLPPLIQPMVIGTGPDRIDLNLSEDAYAAADGGNDALFTIGIDGVQVGGVQAAIASHMAGQTQDFAVQGNFGAGPHDVSINFLNDAYGGTSSMDRNLYVDSVSRAGFSQPLHTGLYYQGSQGFVV
jgi:hypothetical protein